MTHRPERDKHSSRDAGDSTGTAAPTGRRGDRRRRLGRGTAGCLRPARSEAATEQSLPNSKENRFQPRELGHGQPASLRQGLRHGNPSTGGPGGRRGAGDTPVGRRVPARCSRHSAVPQRQARTSGRHAVGGGTEQPPNHPILPGAAAFQSAGRGTSERHRNRSEQGRSPLPGQRLRRGSSKMQPASLAPTGWARSRPWKRGDGRGPRREPGDVCT